MSRVWKFAADVDTDQIVPGRYAPYMRPDADVGEAAFIEARPEFAKNAQPGDIIVATENFGCGSSREYAVEALRRRKVGAIIAVSFARIFFRNAINTGLPVVECDTDLIADGDELELDLEAGVVRNLTQSIEIPFAPLPPVMAQLLADGGLVEHFRKHGGFAV